MDDVFGVVEVLPQHFQSTKFSDDYLQTRKKTGYPLRSHGHSWVNRKIIRAGTMLKLLSFPRLPWSPSSEEEYDKVVLTKVEVESLRSDVVDAEEREGLLKAQLEHVDAILRSARISGYLHIRTRWTELPGEYPIIDDADIDDWLPRFVVLQGSCIFFYLKSTDLSPHDTTLLSEVEEVGLLPSYIKEDQERRHAFYILTCHGLRFECSSISKAQVHCWLSALQEDRNPDLNPS